MRELGSLRSPNFRTLAGSHLQYCPNPWLQFSDVLTCIHRGFSKATSPHQTVSICLCLFLQETHGAGVQLSPVGVHSGSPPADHVTLAGLGASVSSTITRGSSTARASLGACRGAEEPGTQRSLRDRYTGELAMIPPRTPFPSLPTSQRSWQ